MAVTVHRHGLPPQLKAIYGNHPAGGCQSLEEFLDDSEGVSSRRASGGPGELAGDCQRGMLAIKGTDPY